MGALFSTPKPPSPLEPLPNLDDPEVRLRRKEERAARRSARGTGSTILTGGLAKALRAAAPALPAAEETPTVFGLKGRVGRGRANDFPDVKAAKGALAQAGYYPEIFTREADGHVDPQMRSAILGFQSDKGLRIDGWMGPGGQTERELKRTIRPEVLAQKAKETPAKEPAPAVSDEDRRPEATIRTKKGERVGFNNLPDTGKAVNAKGMYEMLRFDPNDWGEFVKLVSNPIEGSKAGLLAYKVTNRTKELIKEGILPPGNPRDNASDAFRHALWNYKMAKELGPDTATRYADAHEITVPNDDGERLMDLYNNEVARRLAADPGNRGRADEEVILEALRAGKLRARKFDVDQPVARTGIPNAIYGSKIFQLINGFLRQ